MCLSPRASEDPDVQCSYLCMVLASQWRHTHGHDLASPPTTTPILHSRTRMRPVPYRTILYCIVLYCAVLCHICAWLMISR